MLKQPSPDFRGFRPEGVRLRDEMLPRLPRLATPPPPPARLACPAFANSRRRPYPWMNAWVVTREL
jgi:hypothetical protein